MTIRKGRVGKRPRTWVAISPQGREAFEREVTALRALIAAVDRPGLLQHKPVVTDTAS